MISQKLVTSVLRKPIQSLDKESIEFKALTQESQKFQGRVEVAWRLENKPKRIHGPTFFLVSSEYNPPYDVILGREDKLQSGI
jgi:hypothetical protein